MEILSGLVNPGLARDQVALVHAGVLRERDDDGVHGPERLEAHSVERRRAADADAGLVIENYEALAAQLGAEGREVPPAAAVAHPGVAEPVKLLGGGARLRATRARVRLD